MIEFLRPLLDFVLPERCPACGVITPAGGQFCGDCWQSLHFLTPPWCASCALPLTFVESEGQKCAACIAKAPKHDGIRAAVAYSDISSKVAVRLKHGRKIALAKLIADQLARHMDEDASNAILVPVPLHRSRLWSRGYNQSALIAHALSKNHGIRHIPDLLIRTRKTPMLRGLSGKERAKTVSGVFAVHEKWRATVADAQIILVDDVYTSGATASACVKTLKKAGAKSVMIYCWARVLPGDIGAEATTLIVDA